MANILDYLAHRFETFDEVPFGPVDALVLSEFCMTELGGILDEIPHAATRADPERASRLFAIRQRDADLRFCDFLRAEHYDTMFTGFTESESKACLEGLAASPRFRTMRIRSYRSVFDSGKHLQFAATAFSYGDLFTFVGFRGTDATIAGWREDFDMAFAYPVPAQTEARRFLEQVVARVPRSCKAIYVGGHSKGGNLAVHAAMNLPAALQERITQVFDNDGPGFRKGVLPAHSPLYSRIRKTVPRGSIVGMLLDSPVKPHVVESSAHGFMQHSGFTWQIDGYDFAYLDELSDKAMTTKRILDSWLAKCTDEEKRAFVGVLFDTLEASGADRFPDLTADWKTTLPLMMSALGKKDPNKDLAWRATMAFGDAVRDELARR